MPEHPSGCPPSRAFAREETLISLPRATAETSTRLQRLAPNDKSEFKFRGLEAGQYYLTAQLPHEAWYSKSITLSAKIPPSAIRQPPSATHH
jgi:hypothetical protein